MNEETKTVMEMMLISAKLKAWAAGASSGEQLRANIDDHIAVNGIIAEYSTGINGALANIITDLLAIMFSKVDWDAVLASAKQQAGQLTIS